MSALEVRNLTKRFGDKTAVDGVSFSLDDGEFLAIVGPSGCGKTTTLRMLVGLETISGGEVRFGERLVNDVRPRDRNVAMVFQDYAIFPHLTVYDNIAYGLRSRRAPRQLVSERVPRAAAAFRIDHLLKRKPRQLSGGERQRVALSRAMVRDAEVYLYDEPLSNLDAQLRHGAREDILTLHREKGKPTVYVTHDQSEAMALGDRIAVMRGGRLEQLGSGTDLYERPRNLFVAFFIGTPSINLFDVRLEAEAGDLYARSGAFSLRLPPEVADEVAAYRGNVVKLGVRPEAFAVPKMATFEVDEGNTVQGLVNVIEPSAGGCSVYLSTLEETPKDFIATLKVRLPSRYLGQEIPLAINPKRLHLFDPETERALLYG